MTVTAWTDMRSLDSGQLSAIDAIVTADGGRQTLASHTVAIDNDTALMVALDENLDPARSGDTLVYTLSYGNRSVSSVQSTTLRLPLPTRRDVRRCVRQLHADRQHDLSGTSARWWPGRRVASR